MSEEQTHNLALPTRITIPSEVLFQDLQEEIVLLNLHTEHYYGLSGIGVRVWQLLTQHGDVAQVMTQLLREYDVDEAILRRDVALLLQKLAQAELVTVAEPASA